MDFLALVQKHFRPRRVALPIFPDGALKRLTMPMMAIIGGKDAIVDSAETRRQMELNVTRAEIRYFPEVGHGILFDQWASILEFLRTPMSA